MYAWKRWLSGTLVVFLAGVSVPTAFAQGATYHYEYSTSLSRGNGVAPLGEALFGENYSFMDGSTTFSVDDVVVPTKAQIPLVFGRTWDPHKEADSDYRVKEDFMKSELLGWGWTPNLPSLRGAYQVTDGFVTGARPRCSGGSVANGSQPYPGGPPIFAYNFWYGFIGSIPGQAGGKIYPTNAGTALPTDGAAYKYATKTGWRVSCLASLKNGSGEGFLIVLPDGSKYTFDWMYSRPLKELSTPYAPYKRTELVFLATKAVDKFGNSVEYVYDPAVPYRPLRMTASDGAEIQFRYNAGGRVSEVISSGRTWKYNYTVETDPFLSSVALPDGSQWAYEKPTVVWSNSTESMFPINRCDYSPRSFTSSGGSPVTQLRITHPSGAVGEFRFKTIAHGYNNTPLASCYQDGQTSVFGRPKAYLLAALVSKKIYGPGLTPAVWNMTYSPSWSYEYECQNGCPNTATTVVVSSSGRRDYYVHGNDFKSNANQLLSHLVTQGSTVVSREDYAYQSSTGQVFPDYPVGALGEEGAESLDNPLFRRNLPQSSIKTYQDGVVFSKTVEAFDNHARPTRLVRGSSPGSPPAQIGIPVTASPPVCAGCAVP